MKHDAAGLPGRARRDAPQRIRTHFAFLNVFAAPAHDLAHDFIDVVAAMSFFEDDGDPPVGQRSFFDDDGDDGPAPGPSRARAAPAPARVPALASSRTAAGAAHQAQRGSSVRPWQQAPRQSSVGAVTDGGGGLADLGLNLGLDGDDDDDENKLPKETLTEELARLWWNERCSPEVLMQKEELLEEAMERIKQQAS